MTTFDFDDYFAQLMADMKKLAADEWTEYQTAAIKDGGDFLKNSADDLQIWTEQLALKQVTPDDLEFLIKGKIDASQLRALKEEGLAKIRIEKFRDSLVSLVLGSLVKVALK